MQWPQLPQARKLSGHAPAHAPLSLRRDHQAQHRSCQSPGITSPHDFVASIGQVSMPRMRSHMPTRPSLLSIINACCQLLTETPQLEQVRGALPKLRAGKKDP
jgi:hypothetical protein